MTDWQITLQKAEKLFDQKQLDEADRLAREVLQSQPDCARALQVAGLVYSERHDIAAAVDYLTRALAKCPDLGPAHNGLGLCYFQRDDLERALRHFNLALCIDPGHAHAHFNRALIWLKRGQYAEGWVEYEWRFAAGLVKRPQIPRPRWDGSPLGERTLLIHTEQGIGDVLQFIRLVPRIKERGGRIVLACQRALHRLLRSLPYIDDWFPIDREAPVNFDVYIPLLSLPALQEITETNPPREVPYIFPEPQLVERWRERMAVFPGLKVGICWQGSPTFKGDRNRSIPLQHFRALGEVKDVSPFSLQKGPGVEQIDRHGEALGLIVFDDLDADGAFIDTAAIMQHLDLVITSDTAVAHLAGALGRPVWVLLGTGADWRWLIDRLDSPWYPTMRLFRQKSSGDWSGLFSDVVAQLQKVIAGKATLPIGVAFTPLTGGAPTKEPAVKHENLEVNKGAASPDPADGPAVSVVIPCFNASRELPSAVQSVVDQGYPDIEVIIVDDLSTDGSLEVAQKLAREHSEMVRVLSQDVNGGPAIARNAGLRTARGRFVCFLDADDGYSPGFFNAVVPFLENDSSLDAVVTGIEFINCEREIDPVQYQALLGSLPSNLLVRRRVASLIGGFPEDSVFRGEAAGEDIAFRTALQTWFRVQQVQQRFLRYRVKSGSHLDFFLDRTKVVDGKLVFTKHSLEEENGAFAAANSRYQAEVERRIRAAQAQTYSAVKNMNETTTPTSAGPPPNESLGELTSIHTSNFPDLLRRLNISLVVTTYQAGRLIFLRPQGDVLNTHFRSFDRPMGLAYHNGHMAIGCGVQVWEFFNVPAVAPKLEPHNTHDACFLPRRTHFTGDIDIHEMAFGEDGTLWFVNTRFCCLCNLDLHSSFVPRWRPHFISQLVPEDRCHLNGLALAGGRPRFVTALGTADKAEGWRETKAFGGALIDVPDNRVLLNGLSMPHSPRWYRDRLWLQESGDGSLGWVDIPAKQYHKICELPGFTRGLDFVGPLAFVGLSQVRESAVFSGIPLGERLNERICGIYAIDIETGEVVAYLHFTNGVQEIFAVQAIPGIVHPELVNQANDWLRHSYVLPDEALPDIAPAGG